MMVVLRNISYSYVEKSCPTLPVLGTAGVNCSIIEIKHHDTNDLRIRDHTDTARYENTYFHSVSGYCLIEILFRNALRWTGYIQ